MIRINRALVLAAAVSITGVVGCSEEPAPSTGAGPAAPAQATTGEKIKDAANNAGAEIKEKAGEVKVKAAELTNKAADAAGKGLEKAGEAIEKGGEKLQGAVKDAKSK